MLLEIHFLWPAMRRQILFFSYSSPKNLLISMLSHAIPSSSDEDEAEGHQDPQQKQKQVSYRHFASS
ncbi:MAG: hypothetical protein AAGB07_12935, partial [Pseudomonadota bacterium]